MKKAKWLASMLMLLAVYSHKTYAQDKQSSDDNINKVSQDSLDGMSNEGYYAYFDSIYRARLPKIRIVDIPDTAKVIVPSQRQQEEFSYSNNYVPDSVSVNTSKAVGEIDIESSISPTGAKVYTVPIKAYQFYGVFCPDISLTYNSQAGSCGYGKGWSVGGLQSIVRGNKSIYFDGNTEGIKMNTNDVFYLNGIRLVHISGNEYETERGNIKAVVNISGDVVKYFNVYYPNGYTAVFGMTSTTANKLEYPITTLTDERGRNITFNYITYYDSYNISSILYDNNSAMITFTYDQTRADYVQGYRGGLLLDNKYLLKTISCTRGSSEIGTYTLSYITDANTSLLEKIDFSANNSSLNPLKFYYGNNSALQGYFIDTANVVKGYTYNSRSALNVVRGRFDYLNGNDGLIVYPNQTPYYHITREAGLFNQSQNYYYNTYNSNDTALIYTELDPSLPYNLTNFKILGNGFITIVTAAIDGDQQESIIKVNNVVSGNDDLLSFTVFLKSASGIFQRYDTRNFYYSTIYTDNDGNKSINPKFFYTGDFNGDGKMEVMAVSADNPFGESNNPSTCYIYDLNNNTTLYAGNLLHFQVSFIGNQQQDAQTAENNSDKLFAVDYNGDGKTDLCHITPSGMDIYEFSQTGSTWSAQKVATYTGLTRSGLANRNYSVGDYNGDGLTDFIVSSPRDTSGNSTWTFYFSKGNGTYVTSSSNQGPNTFNTTSDFLSQDIDGDGITDLVEVTNNDFKGYMVKNNTLTLGYTQSLAYTNAFIVPVSLFSSSLITQFVSLYGTNAKLYTYKTNRRTDHALTGVANSLGVVEKNYYYTLSNSNLDIYSNVTTGYAEYPYCNMFEAIPVVAGDEMFANGGAKNKYKYYNAIANRQGLGFCGFERVTTINKRNQSSIITYEPLNHSILKETNTPTATITNTNTVTVDSYKRLKALVTSRTEYDKLKNITGVTAYTYDTYGQVLTENTSLPGNITVNKAYTYTNFTDISSKYHLGRLASVTIITTRGSSQHSEQTSVTSYNDNDQPLTIINKVNGNKVKTTTMVYDSDGNITSKSIKPYTSQTARTFTYQYSTGNRMTRETPPVGVWRSYSYNTDGTISYSESGVGTTYYTYDAFGRIISESRPDDTVVNTSFSWNTANGGLYAITKSGTSIPTTSIIYDALNREVRSTEVRFNGTTLKVDKTYDTYGDMNKESYPYKSGSPTYKQYTYDSYHRLRGKSEAGKTTSYTYSGLNTTVSDGTMSTTITTDALGGVVSVTDPAGTINYTLNGAGNPISISAPASSGSGITTDIDYDTYERRRTINDPSHGTTAYSYHSTEGYLQSETNARNQTTSYVYDIYGRLTKKTSPEFYTDYTYNNNLNSITAETSSNGTSTTYSYDALGRLSSTRENAVDNKWLQKNYTYSNGNVSAIQYISQNGTLTTENYYYTNGHLTSVKLNGTLTVFQKNSEDNYGHTSGISTLGLTRNYGFNVKGMPTSRSVVYGSQTIQNLTYSFNSATENLTSRYNAENSTTENFSYDNMHRLTSFGGTSVTYDANGNIATKGDVGLFEYNTSGKPYAVSKVTLTNSISVGTQDFSHCSFDRPGMITDNGYTANFTYNGNFERVKMQLLHNGTSTLTRYYLGGCYELDVRPSSTKEKLYLDGDYYDAPVVMIKQGNNVAYYSILRDHLGSITHIVNSTGTVMQELSYDAWGRLRNPSNYTLYTPTNEPELYLGRGYCGHEHLTGLGLINMNARLYDPLLGRFLSSDPYVQAPYYSQSFNRYSYCMNNPLRYADRSGELFGIDDVLFFTIVGAIAGAYLGGVAANSGSKQMWNPLKWDYSSTWTYWGILGGGCLGGYAGSALAAGNMGLAACLVTPFGAIGLNYNKDKNGNPSTDWEINTPMGGHWNSGEEKSIKNADKSIDDAVNSMRDYYNRITYNLSTNSSAIQFYGPRSLVPYAERLSSGSVRLYYFGQLIPIAYNSIKEKNVSTNDQRLLFEMAGGYVGSWIGGRTMGGAMAGLFSETGPGAVIAGGYGYIVGSYMGYQIGTNLGGSLFNLWYDLYYNTYRPLKKIEDYSKSIQNSYQPIW